METLSNLQELIHGLTGVVMALFALLGAFFVAPKKTKKAIIRKIPFTNRSRPVEAQGEALDPRFPSRRVHFAIGFAIMSLIILSAALLPQPPPTREQLLTRAWNASERERWATVVELLTKLLDDCEFSAERGEKQMLSTNAPPPKLGRLGVALSEADAQANFSRGMINDVATALFLRGEAFNHLGKLPEARADWQKVLTYPHAATWDIRTKEFWLTKEGAENKLYQLDRPK